VISEERAEKALRFLVETDDSCAEARGEMERAEIAWKRTREAVFTHTEGTVAERQALAMQHANTREAHEIYVAALQGYWKLHNKRDTEKIVLDVYRTVSANKRMGA
jgi:hypothetical protein